MTRNILAAALIAASFAATAPAAAAPAAPAAQEGAYRVDIPVGDLNLGSAEGMRTLKKRASAAAAEVCGPALAFHRADQAMTDHCRADFRAAVLAAAAERAASNRQQMASR